MRHNSSKKRGMKNKKEGNMKSPLMITLIVLVLFIVLIFFSVLKGPIKDADQNFSPDKDTIKEVLKNQKRSENPMVNINRAVSAGDESLCRRDEICEAYFVLDKATKSGDTTDCNQINDTLLNNNCKDSVLFSNTLNTGNKSLCNQIKNVSVKSICEEI